MGLNLLMAENSLDSNQTAFICIIDLSFPVFSDPIYFIYFTTILHEVIQFDHSYIFDPLNLNLNHSQKSLNNIFLFADFNSSFSLPFQVALLLCGHNYFFRR
jgi:hypothetical protein